MNQTTENIAIIIPARYASTRFPGKPLAVIGGKSMLQRVVEAAKEAQLGLGNTTVMVATEDKRIAAHCDDLGVTCVMTSDECRTGSDRVLAAIENMEQEPDFVVNLQGDAPFTSPSIIRDVIDCWRKGPDQEVVTPIVQLGWHELDILRENKKTTPFSGTTCITDKNGSALWFSKNIIPAMRKEDKLRNENERSPVYQHIGLYGFRTDTLKRFVSYSEGIYEKLEGLEQLRLLENGVKIQTVKVDVELGLTQAGIDSPEDIERAEALLASIK